jgi:hypothetical protein
MSAEFHPKPSDHENPPERIDLRRIVRIQFSPEENPVLVEAPASMPIRSWLEDLRIVGGISAESDLRLAAADGNGLDSAKSLVESGIGNGEILRLIQVEGRENGMGEEASGTDAGTSALNPANGAFLFHESGLVMDLDPVPAVVGRAGRDFHPDIDLSALDRRKVVSRRHARFIKSDDAYSIRPEATTNGTFVNGSEIAPGSERLLDDGDRLQFGWNGVELVFRVHRV